MTVTALLGPLDIPAAAGSERTGKRTVLLVDDDADALTLISEMLRFLGHHVVTAQDGRQALTRLRNTRGIDCLLTDVVMPHGMNGLQLMWAARSARPGLRTALASVRSRDDLRSMGEIPHDVAFFTKPYSLPDISAYLNEV